MRVLHVSKTSEGAFWAARQVRELVRSGVDIHVALPQLSGAAYSAWRTSGAILHEIDCSLPIKQPLCALAKARELRGFVHRVKPDLIHSHFVSTTLTLRLALGRQHPTPRIFQVPGPLHLEHAHTRALEVRSAGENDYWIGSSRYICAAYASAKVSSERVFLSYYSTDGQPELVRERSGYLRERLGIPHDAFLVGNINLIYPPKRMLGQTVGLKCHEDVIEGIRLAQQDAQDIWGVLIGGTFGSSRRYEEKLRALAAERGNGRILMPGKFNADEVARSWPDYDCAVHVPLSENCGGVVEPMMAGVPVIAGRVGGLPEVVHQGLTGEVIPTRSPRQLADAILRVRADYTKYKSMASRGQRLACTMFDSKRCSSEVLAVYRHILYGERRPAEFSAEEFLKQHNRVSAAAGTS